MANTNRIDNPFIIIPFQPQTSSKKRRKTKKNKCQLKKNVDESNEYHRTASHNGKKRTRPNLSYSVVISKCHDNDSKKAGTKSTYLHDNTHSDDTTNLTCDSYDQILPNNNNNATTTTNDLSQRNKKRKDKQHSDQTHRKRKKKHHPTLSQLPPSHQSTLLLPWTHPSTPPLTATTERHLLPLLLPSGPLTRGMMRDQPHPHRRRVLQTLKKRNISPLTALSLRRHHMKRFHPYATYEDLGLGSTRDIRASATIFEGVVERYLKENGLSVIGEEEQRKMHFERNGGRGLPPTPDFLLGREVTVVMTTNNGDGDDGDADGTHGVVKKGIFWVEVKMFYGADSISRDEESAVGRILTTAEKYVRHYGAGAMVFAYGCGKKLGEELGRRGVLALDAGSVLDLSELERFQRRWCADEQGRIMF